jgi:hypothetical protein
LSGAGKTELGISMFEEVAMDHVPVIAIEPIPEKGIRDSLNLTSRPATIPIPTDEGKSNGNYTPDN